MKYICIFSGISWSQLIVAWHWTIVGLRSSIYYLLPTWGFSKKVECLSRFSTAPLPKSSLWLVYLTTHVHEMHNTSCLNHHVNHLFKVRITDNTFSLNNWLYGSALWIWKKTGLVMSLYRIYPKIIAFIPPWVLLPN